MSDQQTQETETETEAELWNTLRHGWAAYLEGAGGHRLTLFPGDAARLAVLLREAQPPAAGTSAAVRAYLAANAEADSAPRPPSGRIDRLRAALAQWVYDVVSP